MLCPCQRVTVQAEIFSCRPLARAGFCVYEYVCVCQKAGVKHSLTRSKSVIQGKGIVLDLRGKNSDTYIVEKVWHFHALFLFL